MYLLIRFFDENELNTKVFKRFGEKYYSPIKQANDNLTSLSLDNIEGAIAIFARKEQQDHLGWKVTNILINNNSITISIQPEQQMDITSGELQRCLYGLLRRKGIINNGNPNTPFLVILDGQDMEYLNRNITKINNAKNLGDLTSLDNLFNNDQWDAVLNFFGPIDKLKEDHAFVWSDDDIISKLAFAASKCCVAGMIPRELKDDRRKLESFLNEKTMKRNQAEALFKRCIELDTNNAKYYSNLGYFYYQNILELTMPNGRRDSNINEEIDKAIMYFDQALSLNDKRIKDYYRKGYLLAAKLPQQLRFGSKDVEKDEIDADCRQNIIEGINCFNKVIELWEKLDEVNLNEKREKDRCYKEYIKSLYTRGKAYEDLFYNYWNEVLYKTLINDKENLFNEPLNISKKHIDYLKEARTSFEKCWICEYDSEQGLDNIELDKVNKVCTGWVEEASDKLYRLGSTYFNIYWTIKNDKKYSEGKAQEYLDKAIEFFNKAKSVKILNNPMLKRKYITEKLARVYITKGNYIEAIKELKNVRLGPSDHYIINTLSLAYYLNKNYNECVFELEPIAKEKRNKVQLYSKLMLGLSYYKLDKRDKASKLFDEIDKNIHNHNAKINEIIDQCK
jgi:hypothetical protein